MMKFCLRIGVIGTLLLSISVVSTDAGILEVYFQDQNIRHTLYTLYEGQIEYVHLQKVTELFRLSADIDPIDGRVVLQHGSKRASFFPGQASVIADRRTHFLDVSPRKIDEVIMLPLQFLTNILPVIYDGDIVWDAGNRRLVVTSQDLEISNLYFSPYGDYTRIVVEMNQAVSYKVTERLPSLLIFELPLSKFRLPQNSLQINSRSVKHVKVIDSFGSTQIIIRIGAKFVRYTHQGIDDPPRILVDIYNTHETLVDTQTSKDILEEDISVEPQQVFPIAPKQFALRTVTLDPGHGGSDAGIVVAPGTEERPDILEKDITLQIVKMLELSLTQRLGVRVVLTREGDDFVSSENRTTIANSNRADVFVSIHVNNSPSVAVSGFEVYIMDYGSLELPEGYKSLSAQSQLLDYAQAKYTKPSTRLAEQILTAYKARNGGKEGTLKRTPLFTLKGTTMPAVHVEIGYASHLPEQNLLIQEEFQQLLVSAITEGIAVFKRLEEQ